ncbi:hypothetical protein HHX47_DHR2000139 [Lentinula edodes]|nr:hypothetical protein HHX47_DHR2000139 [Lentinula edodes]
MNSRSSSPPIKRLKLESLSPGLQGTIEQQNQELNEDILLPDELNEDHCAICLQEVVDRTMIPICSHDLFCFDCLMIWTEQSRRCPLCSQKIGDHLIHNYRSRYDYQKHFLPPLRTNSPKPLAPMANRPVASGRYERRRRIPREIRERSRRERDERDEADRFERALAKRKWIYRHDLYAKFLTTFIISLMKAIDIRSESAVKLLAEFLDMDAPYVEGGRHVNAEHFAHDASSPRRSRGTHRQRSTSPPRERRDRRGRSRSRSISWSPSGRVYPSPTLQGRELDKDESHDGLVLRSPSLEILPSNPNVHVVSSRSITSPQPVDHISHAESPHPSSKGKGKAVADVSMPPEPTPAVEQTIVPSTSSTTSAPKRPPRFVDLHDSIQVHLRSERSERTRKAPPLRIKGQASLSSLSSEAHGVSSLSIKGQGTPSLSSQSNPPSLLSRLSDTYLGEDTNPVNSNPVTTALSSPSMSIDSRHASKPRMCDQNEGPLTREVPEKPRTNPFSPERTSTINVLSGLQDTQSRGRDNRTMTNNMKNSVFLPKFDTNEGSSRASAFLTRGFRSTSNDLGGPNDNPHVDPGFTYEPRINDEALGSNPRPSSLPVDGSHTTVSTYSMRLFHKLEEEKRRLQDNISATLSNSEDSGDVVVGKHSVVATDPQAIEANLRARAQLKMRLASEKRASELPR